MKEIKHIVYARQGSVAELSEQEQALTQKAKNALHVAYAPYSEFKVAAAVLLEDGTIVTGTNQENAAYPSGLCAERVALFYANSQHPDQKVLSIAITAQPTQQENLFAVPPCGACRQVLREVETRYKHGIKVILFDEENCTVFEQSSDLLPFQFDATALKK